MTTLHLKKLFSRSLSRLAPLLIPLVFACFVLAHTAEAVVPAPDGGYPNRTTAEGDNALFNLTTGIDNTALGFDALWKNTTGSYNTAIGEQTLYSNVSGIYNTGTGYRALYSNTGSKNTADGFRALFTNTGDQNTAVGFQALYFNTTADNNTAVGHDALYKNTLGSANTATGNQALFTNTIGINNTANGFQALFSNISGDDNTAIGGDALFRNNTGFTNTAIGFDALVSNTNGNANTAIGFDALAINDAGSANTAVGNAALANSTGIGNTALGASAGLGVTFANNVIVIGTGGSNVTGSCFIGNIRGHTTQNANAVPVVIDSAHQLGTMSSSRRFKHEIKLMDKASEAILALKPVTFHYKSDNTNTAQFGLIAEEVAEVNPDLVVRDADGEIYTVRYDAVNAMLLNEFLKEHRTVQGQQKEIDALRAELKEQKALIQKVSTQLEASKPEPQMVNNP